MFRFGKQVETALIALKALNDDYSGKSLSISEISKQFALSRNTLSKVMQNLHSYGLLKSSQGVKGGYTLSSPLSKITFYQLLESLSEVKKVSCFDGDCAISDCCNIKHQLLRWEDRFESMLHSTTLSELLSDQPSSQHSKKEALV